METLWEVRACCLEAGEDAPVFYNPVGSVSADTDAPVVETVPIPRRREAATCHHEAGHAIFALALGYSIVSTTVDGQAKNRQGDDVFDMTTAQHIACYLAGPIAERWSSRCVYRLRDDDWRPYLDRIRRLRSQGVCDLCWAVRLAGVFDPGAPDADVIAILRDVEAQTIALVQTRPVWLAIRALADALTEHGTVSGQEAEAIAGGFFHRGEYATAINAPRHLQGDHP